MPLELGDYIADLDPNNPLDGESAEKGDDHLRLVKKTVKQSFPNVGGAVTLTHTQLNDLPQDILTAVDATIDFLLPHTEQKGSIKPWSTLYAAIPAGWQLCDGTNNTPDLRDRFIVGAGGSYTVGGSGGSVSATTSSAGGHNHGGATSGHALTKAQMPSHNHGGHIKAYLASTGSVQPVNFPTITGEKRHHYDSSHGKATGTSFDLSGGAVVPNDGSGQAHSHDLGSDGTHSHTVDTRPPYYALAWIIKTSEVTQADIDAFIASLSA